MADQAHGTRHRPRFRLAFHYAGVAVLLVAASIPARSGAVAPEPAQKASYLDTTHVSASGDWWPGDWLSGRDNGSWWPVDGVFPCGRISGCPTAPTRPTSPPVQQNPSTVHDQTGTVQSFWLHLNSTPVTDEMLATEARRRSYVVLNAWEGQLVPKLKAANPAVEVFVYKDLSSTRGYACRDGQDDTHLPAGVGYCFSDRHHPEWFLLGPDGQRLQYGGYPEHWQMDIGNPAYQTAWADNVVSSALTSGFDGVLMDNALFPCDAYHEGVCPTRYPTDESFQQAYRAMLANTRNKFTAAGLKTVANLANARLHDGAWDTYVEHLDGGFDEWWLTFDDTNLLPEYEQGWSRQVAEITSNEARGKITWVQPHYSPGADRPFRYALASYLLAGGSRSAISEIQQTDGYGDPSPQRAEHGWNLGTPVGPHRMVATNVFRRDFACGTVVVNANPSASRAVTVELGDTYVDERGSSVSAVSLPGTSGKILRGTC